MKRVLLDCDGILSDFIGGALKLYNGQYGTDYAPHQVTQFDVGASLGMTKEQGSAFKKLIGSHRAFARALDVIPGAVDGVRRLREIADVYIVTSPWNSNPTWMHDREAWLKEHFDIPHSRVIHTSAKHVCVGDMLVDDKTETCVAWRDAHPRGLAVQWVTLHNRLDVWGGFSTDSWDSLIDLTSMGEEPPRVGA